MTKPTIEELRRAAAIAQNAKDKADYEATRAAGVARIARMRFEMALRAYNAALDAQTIIDNAAERLGMDSPQFPTI